MSWFEDPFLVVQQMLLFIYTYTVLTLYTYTYTYILVSFDFNHFAWFLICLTVPSFNYFGVELNAKRPNLLSGILKREFYTSFLDRHLSNSFIEP